MTATHSIFDHMMFAFLLVVPLIQWRWSWPRYLARLAAGVPNARLNFFRGIVVEEWLPTFALLGIWAAGGRPWSHLMLAGAAPWRLSLGLAFAALLIALLVSQRWAILARPKAIERVRAKLAYAEPLLAHTPAERKVFWLVSATAGVCEEIFYRGFLTWYIAVWTGPVIAVILSSLIFGLGHIYLGRTHVPQTAFVGLFLAGVAFASGSLWPAMLLHAAMDWNSGELGFRILNTRSAEELPDRQTA
jgi:membrane protease YdiL (CAAX protease family)